MLVKTAVELYFDKVLVGSTTIVNRDIYINER